MRDNKIAYRNLRAEMAREDISIQDIARECDFNRDTLSRWLSRKSEIALNDAMKIQKTVFPELDLRYLFHVD